jgi:hypothetical protein
MERWWLNESGDAPSLPGLRTSTSSPFAHQASLITRPPSTPSPHNPPARSTNERLDTDTGERVPSSPWPSNALVLLDFDSAARTPLTSAPNALNDEGTQKGHGECSAPVRAALDEAVGRVNEGDEGCSRQKAGDDAARGRNLAKRTKHRRCVLDGEERSPWCSHRLRRLGLKERSLPKRVERDVGSKGDSPLACRSSPADSVNRHTSIISLRLQSFCSAA